MSSDPHPVCGPVVPTASAWVTQRPLGIRDVRLTGGPWARWQDVNRNVSIPSGIGRLQQEGNLNNLRLAGGDGQGSFRGLRFMDAAVYKLMEAVAWELGRGPHPQFTRFLQSTTDLLAGAQDADGYLNSYYQVSCPEKRYAELDRSHEIYCAGLLMLASVAVQRVGADDGRLLAIARRFADHLVKRSSGGAASIDGHPGAEFGLLELFRLTGQEAYRALAEKMIDERGKGLLGHLHGGQRYRQDHVPVRESQTMVGHAVRALYLETGIIDLFLETGDRSLLESSIRRWDNLVATKTYLTGGVGSRHNGEAIGDAYELPPDRAYNETCAAFASVFWNWRLLLATGQRRYADQIERVLYNAFAASTSIGGERFFYVNPLQRREDHWEGDDPGRRKEWFSCPCCPPNIMRLVASLGHYLATTAGNSVMLHQYAPSEIFAELPNGEARLSVETAYPWSGTIVIEIVQSPPREWRLGLRIPSWCTDTRLVIDDQVAPEEPQDGYLLLTGPWKRGTRITLELDMQPRVVYPHSRIDAVRGCIALERGPLVYCFEQVDHPHVDIERLALRPGAALRSVDHPTHPDLGRTVTIEVDAVAGAEQRPTGLPYRMSPPHVRAETRTTAVAVPYFQWDNRDGKAMRVWLPMHTD